MHSKRRIQRLVIGSAILVGSAIHASAQGLATLDVKALQRDIDGAVQKCMEAEHLPGAALVVVHDGRTIVKQGYGSANVDKELPVDPDKTIFRIGSISKALTLLTLTRLIDSNRLGLEYDVGHYIDGIENPSSFSQPITMFNLLTHTSGLDQIGIGRHVYDFARPLQERKSMRPSLIEFLQDRNLRRVTPAGRQYRYDTYGTTLAGAIIARVTGKRYAEAMKSEMFAPLGMERAAVEVQDEHFADRAIGYGWSNNRYIEQPYEVYVTTPASSIDATVADMGRLLEALTSDGANQHGRLFSPAMAADVLAPQFRVHPEFMGMTHGLHESFDLGPQDARIRTVDHGGNMQGFSALLNILPEYKLGVFVVSNRSGEAGGGRVNLPARVMEQVVRYLPPAKPTPPIEVPPRDTTVSLSEYVGEYAYGVFCHTCSQAEIAQGGWRRPRAVSVQESDGALAIGDFIFVPRGDDAFVREDGRRMVYFGRDDKRRVVFFAYNSSADTFERLVQ